MRRGLAANSSIEAMRWTGNEDADFDLGYPPSGGGRKMIAFGLLLPLVVAAYALKAWIEAEAVWFGRHAGMTLVGDAARAMAVAYFAVATLAHFRWFWGLVPLYRVFLTGTVRQSRWLRRGVLL